MDEILGHLQEAMAILTVPDGESLPFEQVKEAYAELIEAEKEYEKSLIAAEPEETEAERIMRLMRTEGLKNYEFIRWSLMNEKERLQILEILCCNAVREAQRDGDYGAIPHLVEVAAKLMQPDR